MPSDPRDIPRVDFYDNVIESNSPGDPALKLQEEDFGDGLLGITADDAVLSGYNSLGADELFCDPDFPADDSSLYFNDRPHDPEISWVRPKDLIEDGIEPVVLKDGMSRHIRQGSLGDCWFLSSCAAISVNQEFINRIIPPYQVLYGPYYKGIIQVRFWRFGDWVSVFIDDRLPVKNKELLYAACSDPEEFWVSLVEKAYAKLHGSYEAIERGQTLDALVDLTAGIAEYRDLKEITDHSMAYSTMLRAYEAGSYFTCSVKGNFTEVNEHGLVRGHAYTITKVMRVKTTQGERENLIRIRNPWGDATEWNGAFSDGDRMWDLIDLHTKQRMEYQEVPNGEFWMRFTDFCQHFMRISICNVRPDFNGDFIPDTCKGQVACIQGDWVEDVSAGGCRDYESFVNNPQFQLTIMNPDESDPTLKEPDNVGRCSVIVSLMQEHRRSEKHTRVRRLPIGFLIYKNNNPDVRLPPEFFWYNYETESSGDYCCLRQVNQRCELEPGSYVIIPSTFYSDQAATFLIRVFTQNRLHLREL